MQRTEGSQERRKPKTGSQKDTLFSRESFGMRRAVKTLPLICLPCTKSSLNATLEISYFKARKHLMRTVLIKVEKRVFKLITLEKQSINMLELS